MPDDNAAYLEAMQLMNDGDYDEAIARFGDALALEPKRARIHSNLALAACWAGDVEAARAAAQLGCELADHDDPYPALVASEVHHDADRYEEALAAAVDALATDDLSATHACEGQQHKGWALLALDRWREAVSAADAAIGYDAEATGAWSLKASALAEGNRWGEALVAIEQAVAIDPEDDELRQRLRLVKTGLNSVAETLPNVKKGAKGSDDWEDWHELGTVLTMLGKMTEAAAAFDKARKLHPDPVFREAGWSALSPWEADCRLALIEAAAK